MSSPANRADPLLQDANGCLTAAGLEVLRSSAAGRAPAELAAHLGGCVRCQERALAVDAPRPGPRKRTPRPEFPSLGRALLLAALVVAAILAALVTLRQLAPR